ncbi:transposase [Raphidiopsis curvata NIES-932]|nr:transposase [Raphidiopsis curvata NIES-932]
MKLKSEEIEIQNIDHLGIVAGIIDSIGIVEIINELIGVEKDEKVNAGQVVKAMIINGLGFVSKPLYMFPEYFETIACEPEVLNIKKVESMGMIMGLCLLVYTLAQREIRAALRESKSTIKDQLGKLTDRPTLRWIFQCFQGIHLVEYNNKKQVSNWTKDRDFILNLLPNDCLRYYRLVT